MQPAPEGIQIIKVRPGTRREDRNYESSSVSFDVVSEDLGQPLEALFFLDFKGMHTPQPLLCPTTIVEPGTMTQEPKRPVKCPFQLTAETAPGCISVTAVVSHKFVTVLPAPADVGDVALATWFFQVAPDYDSEGAPKYGPCEPKQLPRDGGADAQPDGGLL